MRSIKEKQRQIESEFSEPLPDVISGFAQMGYSMGLVADVLEVSPRSLKRFCARNQIRFSRYPRERRGVSPGRPAKKITYRGKTQTVRQWAAEIGITPMGLYRRLQKMPISEALKPPLPISERNALNRRRRRT